MQRGSPKNRILDYWVGIPLLNLLASFRPRHRRRPEQPTRVGVMCSPALGDALLFSSVLQDLRHHFDRQSQRVEIVHFCMKQNLAAAEIIPGADRRVVIDLTQPAATIRQFRAEHLDVLLDFSSWQRLTAFYSLTAAARFTVGFRTAGQRRGRGYDLAVEHRNDRHEMENFRAILRALGIVTAAAPAVLSSAPTEDPFPGATDLVVFHPWASGQKSWLREWPEGRWIELAQRLATAGTLFVVTGAPADLPRSEPFAARLRAAGLSAQPYVAPDGLRGLVTLLKRARIVVSVNTGVMHLGAIAGAPTVSLNGPTAAHRWGPVGVCARNVGPADGSGGYLNLGFEYPNHPPDVMAKITVDQVAIAIAELPSQSTRP